MLWKMRKYNHPPKKNQKIEYIGYLMWGLYFFLYPIKIIKEWNTVKCLPLDYEKN